LLNQVTGNRDLFRVSQTPGATKTLWAWSLAAKNPKTGGALRGWGADCSSKLTLVDLPGYGFGSHDEWGDEIVTYMRNRKELRRAYVIVDALQGITQSDRKMLILLRSLTIPHQIIVSKCDRSGWQGSQVAVESALRPIRVEAELGSGKHAGFGELILTGGINTQVPYGVAELQWSILRATGWDVYAMSSGPGHDASKARQYNAGTISDTLTVSRGHQLSSLRSPEKSTAQSDSSQRNPEMTMNDFLVELLKIPKPDISRKPTLSTPQRAQPPSSSTGSTFTRKLFSPIDHGLNASQTSFPRSNTGNPVDQRLMSLLAESRSQPLAPTPNRITPVSTPRVSPAIGKGVLTGADAFGAMSDYTSSSSAATQRRSKGSARPLPSPPSTPSNQAPTLTGKGVSRGLDAFESMFAATAPALNKKKGSKGSRSRSAVREPPPSLQVAAPVPVGKGVTRGLDAFESMFAAEEPKQGSRKKRRH